jgi:hypothetical protein
VKRKKTKICNKSVKSDNKNGRVRKSVWERKRERKKEGEMGKERNKSERELFQQLKFVSGES